jgi:hypothetical protein
MRSMLLLGASALALVACGGNVVVDATSTTGTGGSTSSTSSSSSTTSTTSSTTSASSSSSGAPCPDPFPGVEATCTTEGMTCAVPGACCQGNAVCQNGFWSYQAPACAQPCSMTCGPDGFACAVGEVCVALLGPTTVYQCAPNPCGSGNLSCVCADALCTPSKLSCNNIQMGFKVLCD